MTQPKKQLSKSESRRLAVQKPAAKPVAKKEPPFMRVSPDKVKRGMWFNHLGMVWEVSDVRKEGVSTAFYARLVVCPAGYVDCKVKLDVHSSNKMEWHRESPSQKK